MKPSTRNSESPFENIEMFNLHQVDSNGNPIVGHEHSLSNETLLNNMHHNINKDGSELNIDFPSHIDENQSLSDPLLPITSNTPANNRLSTRGRTSGGKLYKYEHKMLDFKRIISVLVLFIFICSSAMVIIGSFLLHKSSTSVSALRVNPWWHPCYRAQNNEFFQKFKSFGPIYNISNSKHINPLKQRPEKLEYNPQHRKASKKLYELLADFDTAFYDDDNMILGTNKFLEDNTYSRQPYVANGYMGTRLPNIGFGYAEDSINIWTPNSKGIPDSLNNGWPLRNRRFTGAFISDFYCLQKSLNSTNFPELDDDGYTTVISSIPQWTNLQFSVNFNKTRFDFTPRTVQEHQITNYNQNLSMKNGVVTTEMDYIDSLLHIKSEVWVHRRQYPLGLISLEITLNSSMLSEKQPTIEIDIRDILDFDTGRRITLRESGYEKENNAIFMVVHPENVPYSNAAIYSAVDAYYESSKEFRYPRTHIEFNCETTKKNSKLISQSGKIILSKTNNKVVINKYNGVISTEFNVDKSMTNLKRAKEIVLTNKGHYNTIFKTNTEAWAALYNEAFIEIPSDSLLEMTARSSLFHILANTRKFDVSDKRGLPVPVSGLSSDSYGGMVFWDADIWMQPAVLPFFPDIAKQMSNYRNASHFRAVENAQKNGYPGALYPWTSGRYANCTSTGPCVDYEYHINVDVAMATFSIYMNGGENVDDDYLRYTTWPIVRDAAVFFSSFVKYNQTLGKYETYNLTDPDEFANFINNGAFTNAGIKTLLKWATDIGNHLGEYVNPRWMEISQNIYIPRSPSNITLEYSGMNSSVEVKQADVTLMVYPLGYLNDESILNNAVRDLYYYSGKQSASGPAMTYPVFVAAASTLLNHGSSSQSYLYKSVLPYLRSPFAQFSEQSDDNFLTNGLTQPAFPFLTANGGFLQSILFGLTGIRYTYEVDKETKQMYRVLRFNPVELPRMPGGIAIRNFKYMNQVLDIIIDDHNGTIIHKNGEKPIIIKVPDRSMIHDRDVSPYRGINNTARVPIKPVPKAGSTPTSEDDRSEIPNVGTYYIINPKEELTLPLFKLKPNIEGNIVERAEITNLTEGVPGDVAVSILDGNNYTHWQPANKHEPARLLIDLGKDNEQEIKKGMILWGGRPAKKVSLSILPYSIQLERILSKVTDELEEVTIKNREQTIGELLEDIGEYMDKYIGICDVPEGKCDATVEEILNWKLNDFENIMSNVPQLSLLNSQFVSIMKDLEVTPSEPFFPEVITDSLIEILPSNITYFDIDYSKIKEGPNGKTLADDLTSRKTRFILLTVEGTFDDDYDMKGGTLCELVLK